MSFLAELQRRKVIRVALAYLVAAWVIAQVAELVADSFAAPAWFMQVLLVLLALGLPAALLLAWAFDLTPEGLVRDAELTPQLATRSSRLLTWVTAGLVVVGLALGVYSWQTGGRIVEALDPAAESAVPPPAPVEQALDAALRSIAVLPFENFSGDPADEYFADGLADTLLHKLAQIEQLKVIARNSSFQYKGRNVDIRAVGRELGVDIVLEGSVQRAGDKVRVIAQLIRTADGGHLWSQSFDDSMDNIFELQDRIAEDIAAQFEIALTAEQRRRMMRDGTDDPEAYELLMRAINMPGDLDRMADVDDTNWPPVQLVRQALELDPRYVQAWARLSAEYNWLAFAARSAEKYERFVAESEAAARRAVELGPDLAEGHLALGWVAHRKGESLEAERHLRRALAIEPNNSAAMGGLALQLARSRPEEALELLQRVEALEPTNLITHRQKHFALMRLGRFEDAVAELRTAIDKDPGAGIFYADLAELLIGRFGRPDEAAVEVSKLLHVAPEAHFGLAAMLRSWTAAGAGEEAAAWSALLRRLYPDSDEAAVLDVRRLLAAGEYAAALEALDAVPPSQEYAYDLSSARLAGCLALARVECAARESEVLRDLVERAKVQGQALPEWDVVPVLAAALTAELEDPSHDASAELALLMDLVEDNAFVDPYYVMRAGLAARVGDPDRAMAILESSLADRPQAWTGQEWLNLPVESSPLLRPLRGRADFNDWLQRHRERGEALRERMRSLQSRGEILSAAAVERQLATP